MLPPCVLVLIDNEAHAASAGLNDAGVGTFGDGAFINVVVDAADDLTLVFFQHAREGIVVYEDPLGIFGVEVR